MAQNGFKHNQAGSGENVAVAKVINKPDEKTDFVKYPVAKSHKIIHAAPQFRPIKRGARRKGLLRKYETKNGSKLTIKLFWELDIADQDLLLCLLGMSMSVGRGSYVSNNPETERGKELRKALELKDDVAEMASLMVCTSATELLKELGRSNGGKDRKWLDDALDRLSSVSFKYESRYAIWSFNLLSSVSVKNDEGLVTEIVIMINPISAIAILGERDDVGNEKQSYVLCHRRERHDLKSDEAKALHSVLCGLVDMGKWRELNVDMLADKVYSRYDDVITPEAAEHRRRAIVEAAAEINRLKYWSCTVRGRGASKTLEVKRKTRSQDEEHGAG
jgi:hypothetical protein